MNELNLTPAARDIAIKKMLNIGHAMLTLKDGLVDGHILDEKLATQVVMLTELNVAQLSSALGLKGVDGPLKQGEVAAKLRGAEHRIAELEAEVLMLRSMSKIMAMPAPEQKHD